MADTNVTVIATRFRPGARILHELYGAGTIIAVEESIKMGDHNSWDRTSQSSIIRSSNGASRYAGQINVAVKFDKGGPQGFALDASNSVDSLRTE
jgi:hypothetical protein